MNWVIVLGVFAQDVCLVAFLDLCEGWYLVHFLRRLEKNITLYEYPGSSVWLLVTAEVGDWT